MSKKVIQLLDGKPIAIYGSIGSAARKNNLKYKRLQDALHGRKESLGGYTWRFATPEEIELYGHFHVKKCIQ